MCIKAVQEFTQNFLLVFFTNPNIRVLFCVEARSNILDSNIASLLKIHFDKSFLDDLFSCDWHSTNNNSNKFIVRKESTSFLVKPFENQLKLFFTQINSKIRERANKFRVSYSSYIILVESSELFAQRENSSNAPL